MGEIANRITRKNQNLESTLPLTISAQYGLIDQNEFFDKRIASKDVSGYYLLKKGEFAYNKSYSSDAPWGAVKRLDRYENGVLSTLYIVFEIIDSDKTDSDFIVSYYDTDRWHKQVQAIAAEGARNHGLLNISPNDFFETVLTIPKSVEEQQQIGSYFRNLDHLITLHQRKLFYINILGGKFMLGAVKDTDLFCDYYAKWIAVYKKGAIRKVTLTNLQINNVKYGTYPVITCTGTYGNPNIAVGKDQMSNSVSPTKLSLYGTTINVGDETSTLYTVNISGGYVKIVGGSYVNIGTSSYYAVMNNSREFRPSTSSSSYPFYLGTSGYPWHYGNIGTLNVVTSAKLGTTTGAKVGFFGTTPIGRKAVSRATGSTVASCNTAINNLITALKAYGLIS